MVMVMVVICTAGPPAAPKSHRTGAAESPILPGPLAMLLAPYLPVAARSRWSVAKRSPAANSLTPRSWQISRMQSFLCFAARAGRARNLSTSHRLPKQHHQVLLRPSWKPNRSSITRHARSSCADSVQPGRPECVRWTCHRRPTQNLQLGADAGRDEISAQRS